MVSEFMKRMKAERIAQSQFKVGTEVAVINHHWERRIEGKRKVVKVYANGNFVISSLNDYGSQWQWIPNGDTARKAGKDFTRQHLEIWTPAIDEEIASRKLVRTKLVRIDAIMTKLKQVGPDAVDEKLLDHIEAALGMIKKEEN